MAREKKEKTLASLLKNTLKLYEMPDISLPTISARGNREVCVEGCKGILEYEQSKIKLNAGRLVICFIGDGIEISAYSDIQTVITGNILSIEFQGNTEV